MAEADTGVWMYSKDQANKTYWRTDCGGGQESVCGGTKVLVPNRRMERHSVPGACVVGLGATIQNSLLDMFNLECEETLGGAISQQLGV